VGHNSFLPCSARRGGVCGLPAAKIHISYNAGGGEALENVVIPYSHHKGSPNVIYTFGLHTPRTNENDDVRLFDESVSGFRVK
jgi:hypothetical protein